MAGDWIKVEKATARKPEVLRLAELLDIHPDHAFGLCVRFWFWCDDQLDSCHAQVVTNVTLDYTVGHTGFATALLEVGWLRARDGSLEVPNFDRHLSDSAKKRADSLRRKQKQRSRDATEMSHKKRDKSVTRDREEIEKSIKKNTKEKSPAQDVGHDLSSKPKYSQSDMEAARHLWERITEVAGAQRPPDFEKWADTIRLMRERDKRSPVDILAMINTAHDDAFWRGNVLSPEKLRQHWLRLSVLKSQPSTGGAARVVNTSAGVNYSDKPGAYGVF